MTDTLSPCLAKQTSCEETSGCGRMHVSGRVGKSSRSWQPRKKGCWGSMSAATLAAVQGIVILAVRDLHMVGSQRSVRRELCSTLQQLRRGQVMSPRAEAA